MKSLKDKIKDTTIEYEQSDIYYQILAIALVLIIVIIAFLLVRIDYTKIPFIGTFIDFSIDIILSILNFVSKVIRKLLDLF
ncbi:MAG: hypothetical protein LUH02_09585 [Erysipelotrichaceae bacterium]|nr:hypothetical protein [Erysipelotrichaceae bacterium]